MTRKIRIAPRRIVKIDDDLVLPNARMRLTSFGDVIIGPFLLRRYVLGVPIGDRRIVTHINGDKLDCQRHNLKIQTRSEFRLGMKYNGSLPTNVQSTNSDRYRVVIERQHQRFDLGLFDTIAEAVASRDAFLNNNDTPPDGRKSNIENLRGRR